MKVYAPCPRDLTLQPDKPWQYNIRSTQLILIQLARFCITISHPKYIDKQIKYNFQKIKIFLQARTRVLN